MRRFLQKISLLWYFGNYLVFVFPGFALAQEPLRIFEPAPGAQLTFTSVANKIGGIANVVIPFLVGVALAFVLWGVFKYISAAGDEEKLAEGRKAALYGLLALFLMVAFWGIVMVIKKSLFG
ncbi:MAG: hypothetical protein Greene041679_40 [Parcubacteria group bacterium Greene0416_79]|nr:MAG: hypothetical protein Greene041679_40 [Parcubacteria group bacterium Greene0416_79]